MHQVQLCWLNDETKKWNRSRLDHREHLLTRSHIFLDLKLRSELLKKKNHVFHSRRAVAAGRHTKEQQIVCMGNRQGSAPACTPRLFAHEKPHNVLGFITQLYCVLSCILESLRGAAYLQGSESCCNSQHS